MGCQEIEIFQVSLIFKKNSRDERKGILIWSFGIKDYAQFSMGVLIAGRTVDYY